MKKTTGIFFFFLLALSLPAQEFPCDRAATKETTALYNNLKKLLNKGIMFGHQDDLAYGVGWKYDASAGSAGRSDIKDVTGEYPAIYGWELGHLEIDRPVNLDSVPFKTMQQLIKKGYERGGVITISWHLNNPLTGKTAWDPAQGTVASVLPGGSKHDLFKTWLDKIVVFMNGLKGNSGEFIPVIFRPYHELNGSWFWWGGKNCTPDEFKKLWKFTVSYLRDEKDLHHLLYAYNTDRYSSKEEYLLKYPGDEWVDVIGFDIYQRNDSNEKFIADVGRMLSTLEDIATEKNKIPALTEFGGNLTDNNWWTGTFLKALSTHRISYVLGWRNAGQKPGGEFEYYVPYKGHSASADFVRFYESDRTLFQKDVNNEKLYQ
ncbi:MAG TPA: glycosyl hydrolase [Chitinophagaceae bacterium]